MKGVLTKAKAKKSWLVFGSTIALVLISTAAIAATTDNKKVMHAVASLDIFGLTNELVDLTSDMLTDTKELSNKINQVGVSVSMLDVQKQELEKQVTTNTEIVRQLNKQLELNKEARGLMQNILSLQGQTAQLTNRVGTEAVAVTNQVVSSAGQLAGVGNTTGKMNAETDALLQRLQKLNGELQASADSFRFVGRLAGLKKLLPAVPAPVTDTVKQVNQSVKNILPPVLPLPDLNNVLLPHLGGGTPDGQMEQQEQQQGQTEQPSQSILPAIPAIPSLPTIPIIQLP